MEKLWTTAEVAQCLGITEPDVEALVRQGRLTGYKLGGRFLRFRPVEVETLRGTAPSSVPGTAPAQRHDGRVGRVQEFFYFYDFYLISATCLAAVIIYLIASG